MVAVIFLATYYFKDGDISTYFWFPFCEMTMMIVLNNFLLYAEGFVFVCTLLPLDEVESICEMNDDDYDSHGNFSYCSSGNSCGYIIFLELYCGRNGEREWQSLLYFFIVSFFLVKRENQTSYYKFLAWIRLGKCILAWVSSISFVTTNISVQKRKNTEPNRMYWNIKYTEECAHLTWFYYTHVHVWLMIMFEKKYG